MEKKMTINCNIHLTDAREKQLSGKEAEAYFAEILQRAVKNLDASYQ